MELPAFYNTLLNTLPEAIVIIEPFGRVIFANRAFAELTGFEAAPKSYPQILQFLQDASISTTFNEKISISEKIVTIKNGKRLWVKIELRPFENKNREWKLLVFEDITEKKVIEDKLAETITKYKLVAENSTDMISLHSIDGKYLYASESCTEICGYLPSELRGKNMYEIIDEEDIPQVAKSHLSLEALGVNMSIKYRLKIKNGKKVWVETKSKIVEHNHELQIIAVTRDIEHDIKAGEALNESEKRYRSLVSNLPGVVYRCLYDEHWTMKFISDQIEVMTGYPASDFVDNKVRSFASIVHPIDNHQNKSVYEAIVEKKPFSAVYRLIKKNGETIFIHENGRAIYGPTGEINYLDGVFIDITPQKTAENALKDSEELYRTLLETIPDGILVSQPDEKITYASPNFLKMLGYTDENQLKDMRPLDFIAKEDKERAKNNIGQIFNGRPPRSSSYRLLNSRGKTFPAEINSGIIRNNLGGPKRMVTAVRDITNRQLAQQKIKESEARYRCVVSNAPIVMFEISPDGIFKLSDGKGLISLGLEPGQVVGQSVFDVYKTVPEIIENIKKALMGEPSHFTANLGHIIFDAHHIPVFDNDNKISTVIGVAMDITDRVQKEKELEQKNAELERFSYTVSHDLKSPLVTIKAFLGYLEADMKNNDKERIQKDLFYIHNAAGKMAQLLDELLELSRIGRKINPPSKISFNALVNEVLIQFQGKYDPQKYTFQVSPSPINVFGDYPRLAEVIYNLVDNAIKFTSHQPNPKVEIGEVQINNEICFYVKDNGIGIDPRYKHKLFGLFEKLDPSTDGTGIGLALIKRILEFHNCRIWAESEGTNQGTCFYFTLPMADKN
jgi:PAS domain S-box-containing protein